MKRKGKLLGKTIDLVEFAKWINEAAGLPLKSGNPDGNIEITAAHRTYRNTSGPDYHMSLTLSFDERYVGPSRFGYYREYHTGLDLESSSNAHSVIAINDTLTLLQRSLSAHGLRSQITGDSLKQKLKVEKTIKTLLSS
jgi:hypothetical protein